MNRLQIFWSLIKMAFLVLLFRGIVEEQIKVLLPELLKEKGYTKNKVDHSFGLKQGESYIVDSKGIYKDE